ncbi:MULTISPECIES: ribosomal L7Ae/L30e/S12e/Gadd45 family protein [Carboxydocella]|uniref:Ribosomal protein L7Ae n=2 Tax=Carboxydocella TaxID=178898 RepID=A0A1T4P897_9FIRM|nr:MULTISPECIES: ribosomal L7Ae/L30e/S12e/Gadd45 family protein [Carboxydocella]AVX20721.1 Ribosomal protein L7Ae [Carboxydocella thermautotrophica]AVX31140.1 Ribosomal protein L7Ae [Carboxydocella thermautotrophica]SJZ87128.1 Ribosomal protein L7Ae [Carboxydocella sporoproducens DSM 16521]GAW28250.1 ribosomal protein HS6-type (S12/L30/L7a) [Carboxydocella sp. ULO1]GAW30717.1 ribosomal protein HS6-type (S12/L30/L7a) [Carboxydocella sp. JDF658]
MRNRWLGLLGLGQRSGKVVSGEAAVEAMLKKGKGELLVLAGDLNSKRINVYQHWAKSLGIKSVIAGTKTELGIALGKSPRAVVLILDAELAKAVYENLV